MEKDPVMRAWLATMAARVAVTSIGLKGVRKTETIGTCDNVLALSNLSRTDGWSSFLGTEQGYRSGTAHRSEIHRSGTTDQNHTSGTLDYISTDPQH